MPMLMGALLQNLQSVIDLFWVGRLGPVAIAAVAMGGTVMMVLFPMLMGISTGTVAIIARAIGAGDRGEASAAAGQSLTLALVVGVISGMAGWGVSDALLRLLGASPAVVADGGAYLRISLVGSFTAFMLFIANAALQGAGDAMTPMLVMALANVLNLVLDRCSSSAWVRCRAWVCRARRWPPSWRSPSRPWCRRGCCCAASRRCMSG